MFLATQVVTEWLLNDSTRNANPNLLFFCSLTGSTLEIRHAGFNDSALSTPESRYRG